MISRLLSFLSAGLMLVGLLVLAGCIRPCEDDGDAVRDLAITVKCGTDVSLRFNVSGHIEVPVHDMLGSRCNLHGNGSEMTIECPGNGRNWTQIVDDGLKKLHAVDNRASPLRQPAVGEGFRNAS